MMSLKAKMKALDARKTNETAEHASPRAIELQGCLPANPQQQQQHQPGSGGGPADQVQPLPSGQAGPLASKYLVISVIEARNLVAKDYDTHSSDPFVKITLAGVSKKTRAIYRNCHPLWQQKLVFPIDSLSEAEPLLVELFDRDVTGKEFLGQVMMTLGKALEIEADVAQRDTYWLVLSKKRSTDIVGGKLCLGFDVTSMDPQQHMLFLADLEAQLNPELLAASYSSKALHIQLKGLNGLAASGLFGAGRGATRGAGAATGKTGSAQKLSLFIKYGKVMLEKPLQLPAAAPHTSEDDDPGRSTFLSSSSSSCCPDVSCELAVNQEVIIPLAAAVRAQPLVARKRDELCDIKLYLRSQDTLIAKTQIPITAVPFSSNVGAGDDDDDGSSSPRSPRSPPSGGVFSTSSPPSSARAFAPDLLPKLPDSSHRDLAALATASAPSTPRGVTMEYNGPTQLCSTSSTTSSSSSPLCELPASPMGRGRSDAFGLAVLNKRLGGLGGWVGSSSNLCTVSTASHCSSLTGTATQQACHNPTDTPQCSQGGAKAAGMAVEGSLGSVTSYTRGHQVHAPAGLHGRRVQGLAELHEATGTNVLRKPLKAMFVPPREIKAMDWAPSKTHAEEGDDAAGTAATTTASPRSSRSFCRVMESTVPMYCNLEISLSLAVLDQKATASMPDAAAATVEVSTGSAVSTQEQCEEGGPLFDDEEAVQATPIQLPAAYEVVLQDTTLQGIGVNRLYTLLFSADSQLMKTHHAAQEVTEVAVKAWRAPSAAAAFSCMRVRDVSYTKRLNIPLPLAPDKCHVWEEHRLLTREAGGWVVQVVCKNDAPKGDCFEAHVQMCGVYVNSNDSRLRVSMQLNWTKNTWGKSMVQGGAETDARRSYEALVKLLRQQARSSSSCGDIDQSATAQQSAVGLSAEGAAPAPPATAGRRAWPGLYNHTGLLLHFATFLSLLLLAWAVVSAGQSISRELHELAVAVKTCSSSSGGDPSAMPAKLF